MSIANEIPLDSIAAINIFILDPLKTEEIQ